MGGWGGGVRRGPDLASAKNIIIMHLHLHFPAGAGARAGAVARAGAGAVAEMAPPVPSETAWDGGDQRLACAEYAAGGRKRRVVQCLFDGYHGSWLPAEGRS